jgi:hypothetical protein
MIFNAPQERLYLARLRQCELRDEAVAARRTRHSIKAPVSIEQVKGLHLRLGRLMIIVGRTLRDDDARHASPSHS